MKIAPVEGRTARLVPTRYPPIQAFEGFESCSMAADTIPAHARARPRSRRKRAEDSRRETPAKDDDPVWIRLAQAS